jgi:hypothetical protein
VPREENCGSICPAARTSREGGTKLSVLVAKTRSNFVFGLLQHLVSNRKTGICIGMTAALHMRGSAIVASRLRHHVCDSRMQPRVLWLFPPRQPQRKPPVSPWQGKTQARRVQHVNSNSWWKLVLRRGIGCHTVSTKVSTAPAMAAVITLISRTSVDNSKHLRLCHDSHERHRASCSSSKVNEPTTR